MYWAFCESKMPLSKLPDVWIWDMSGTLTWTPISPTSGKNIGRSADSTRRLIEASNIFCSRVKGKAVCGISGSTVSWRYALNLFIYFVFLVIIETSTITFTNKIVKFRNKK